MSDHRRSAHLARVLLERPWISALVLLAILGGSVAAATRLRIEAGVDTFFDKRSPLQAQADEVDAQFVSDDLIFVLYQTPDVLSPQSLAMARDLGHRYEDLKLPGEGDEPLFPIEDVTSLTTVKTLVGSDQAFQTEPLVPDPIPQDQDALRQIRDRLHANPIIRHAIVSADHRVAMIVLRVTSGLSDAQQAELVGLVRALADETTATTPGTVFEVFGDPVVETDSAHYQTKALEQFIPVVYAIIVVLLFVFLARTLGVIVALINCTIAMIAGAGVLVLIGSSINNCSVMLPPLTMALSVASLIHLFSEYGKVGRRLPHAEARQTTLAELLLPLFMASATTAVGFGSLAVSRIPAVHEFGIASALTMMVLLVIVVTLVALCWRWWPPDRLISQRGMALSGAFSGFLAWLAELLIRRRHIILALGGVTTLFMCVGMALLNFDQNQIEFFEPEAPIRRANDFMEAHISGSTLLVVSVRGDRDEQFLEPTELTKLLEIQHFLEQKIGADLVTSIIDYLRLMNREFQGGDPAQHRIPDSAQQAAQLLLLNGDTTVDEYIDPGHRWVRMVARIKEHRSAELSRIYAKLDAALGARFPAAQGYTTYATGGARLFSTVFMNLIYSQSQSLTLSVLLIFGMMFLMFGSARTGIFSVPPNAFPILSTLGLMGWLGINLDAATVMISTVALGIAVDDTIHFLEYYRGRLSEHGDPERGVRETLQVKGPAIIATSVVIGLGFVVLLVADFVPTQNFGVLTAIAMFAALIGDILFLPALLLVTRSRLGTRPAQVAEAAP